MQETVTDRESLQPIPTWFLEKVDTVKAIHSNRGCLTRAMREYNSLVHERRNYDTSGLSQDTTVFAVEDSIQPFVEDAVKDTFSLVWNSLQTPFIILHNDQDLAEDPQVIEYYEEVTWIMQRELNKPDTNFKFSLESVIKMLLEYGTAACYLIAYDQTFFSDTYSLESFWVEYDSFKQVQSVVIETGLGDEKKTSLFEKQQEDLWSLTVSKNNLVYWDTIVDYTPIFIITSGSPNVKEVYPVGAGLSSLPEIRKLNALVQDLTTSAAAALKPTKYENADANIDQRVGTPLQTSWPGAPLKVSMPPTGNQVPFGYVPSPTQPAPAWELWNQIYIKLREKFGSINRLLSLKDNVQITATEATIRSRADLNQLKNMLDNIFYRFLNPLHLAQMRILSKKFPPIPEILKKKQFDVTFIHNSIFQKQQEDGRIEEIRMGLGVINEALQVAQNAQSMGNEEVSFQGLIKEISSILNIPTEASSEQNVLMSLLSTASLKAPEEAAVPEEEVPGQIV